MTFLPLQLPPGIVRGANPDDAPGRWFDGNMVRWRDGIMEPIGGWEATSTAPFSTPVRAIHQWRDNWNQLHTISGTDGKLRSLVDGAWVDVTPTGLNPFNSGSMLAGYGSALYGKGLYNMPPTGPTRLKPMRHAWSMSNWGEDLLVCASSDGRLLHYSSLAPTSKLTFVTEAPIDNRGVIVTQERHAMLLGVDGDPRTIGWSSRENFRDWDFASTTNTAGTLPLRAETPLMSAVLVREGVLVFSETEAFLVRYVNLPYIYGADELGHTALLAPRSYAEFEGKVAWLDQSGFMLYQGGAITSLASPLTDYVFSDMNHTFAPRNSHAVSNGMFNEVWFFYPSSASMECDRVVIWNYAENWWSMGMLARSAGFAAGADMHPLMGSPGGIVYQHETGWAYDGFDPTSIYIASGTVNVGDGEQALHISQIIPSNGANYDATNYTLYTRMTPAQAEAVNGPYAARADGYVDTRAMGRDVRVKIAANRAGDWSIGRLRMKVAAGGRR